MIGVVNYKALRTRIMSKINSLTAKIVKQIFISKLFISFVSHWFNASGKMDVRSNPVLR